MGIRNVTLGWMQVAGNVTKIWKTNIYKCLTLTDCGLLLWCRYEGSSSQWFLQRALYIVLKINRLKLAFKNMDFIFLSVIVIVLFPNSFGLVLWSLNVYNSDINISDFARCLQVSGWRKSKPNKTRGVKGETWPRKMSENVSSEGCARWMVSGTRSADTDSW